MLQGPNYRSFWDIHEKTDQLRSAATNGVNGIRAFDLISKVPGQLTSPDSCLTDFDS